MYKTNMKIYKCSQCNKSCTTKNLLDQHQSFCIFIHTSAKEHQINNEKISLPSPELMFQYMIHLTNKYEQLEQKLAKIEKNSIQIRRKHVDEYIKTLEIPNQTFSSWLEKIQITDDDLEILFSDDLKNCIKCALEKCIKIKENMPICAFYQKQNSFYIYDGNWRLMSNDEFSRLISILSHRVLKKYMVWSNQHKEQLESNTKTQELAMSYLKKANGLNCSLEACTNDLKKWLFTKINISIKNIDF